MLSNGSPDSRGLTECLAAVLPQGHKFGVYHLSTPPTRTEALCSAPPDAHPDKTYVEKHFLGLSVNATLPVASGTGPGVDTEPPKKVLVFAVEVFIFTTAFSSTFFVSKADSTGYLNLLNLPANSPSPIKGICSTFIAFLVGHRRRVGLQCVVSLFARAQNQYLFPGSVENAGKHVLDDRGLVKWWCRVLTSFVVEAEKPEAAVTGETKRLDGGKTWWSSVKGYLVVPGLDRYETRAFLPRAIGGSVPDRWVLGHPTHLVSHYTSEYDWVPPRCLIPRYPDDPKSRYRDELDLEAQTQEARQQQPGWGQGRAGGETGAWRSVKTVDQFWEMMAFRQECSSGRLTGFIWVVLDPVGAKTTGENGISSSASSGFVMPSAPCDSASSQSLAQQLPPSTPPKRLAPPNGTRTPQSSPLKPSTPGSATTTTPPTKSKRRGRRDPLTGAIRAREPHVKTTQRNYLADRTPPISAYYFWPDAQPGRGAVLVDEADYHRGVELLLRLDFANLELAVGSTRRWVAEVGGSAGGTGSGWGQDIEGKQEPARPATAAGAPGAVNNLTGLVKRKRPAEDAVDAPAKENGQYRTGAPVNGAASVLTAQQVNVLAAGLIRKKKKEDSLPPLEQLSAPASERAVLDDVPKVTVLSAGLVRKKPKVQHPVLGTE